MCRALCRPLWTKFNCFFFSDFGGNNTPPPLTRCTMVRWDSFGETKPSIAERLVSKQFLLLIVRQKFRRNYEFLTRNATFPFYLHWFCLFSNSLFDIYIMSDIYIIYILPACILRSNINGVYFFQGPRRPLQSKGRREREANTWRGSPPTATRRRDAQQREFIHHFDLCGLPLSDRFTSDLISC